MAVPFLLDRAELSCSSPLPPCPTTPISASLAKIPSNRAGGRTPTTLVDAKMLKCFVGYNFGGVRQRISMWFFELVAGLIGELVGRLIDLVFGGMIRSYEEKEERRKKGEELARKDRERRSKNQASHHSPEDG